MSLVRKPTRRSSVSIAVLATLTTNLALAPIARAEVSATTDATTDAVFGAIATVSSVLGFGISLSEFLKARGFSATQIAALGDAAYQNQLAWERGAKLKAGEPRFNIAPKHHAAQEIRKIATGEVGAVRVVAEGMSPAEAHAAVYTKYSTATAKLAEKLIPPGERHTSIYHFFGSESEIDGILEKTEFPMHNSIKSMLVQQVVTRHPTLGNSVPQIEEMLGNRHVTVLLAAKSGIKSTFAIPASVLEEIAARQKPVALIFQGHPTENPAMLWEAINDRTIVRIDVMSTADYKAFLQRTHASAVTAQLSPSQQQRYLRQAQGSLALAVVAGGFAAYQFHAAYVKSQAQKGYTPPPIEVR